MRLGSLHPLLPPRLPLVLMYSTDCEMGDMPGIICMNENMHTYIHGAMKHVCMDVVCMDFLMYVQLKLFCAVAMLLAG